MNKYYVLKNNLAGLINMNKFVKLKHNSMLNGEENQYIRKQLRFVVLNAAMKKFVSSLTN